jgi:hypothetical protein
MHIVSSCGVRFIEKVLFSVEALSYDFMWSELFLLEREEFPDFWGYDPLLVKSIYFNEFLFEEWFYNS